MNIKTLTKQKYVLLKKGLSNDEIIDYYKNSLDKLEKQINEEENKLSPSFDKLEELKNKRFFIFCFYNSLNNKS